MDKILKRLKRTASDEKGISLIGVAFFILASGIMMSAGARLYHIYDEYNSAAVTDEKIAYVQSALQQYFSLNGRYPCPAPLNAPVDTAGFGKEVTNDCAGVAPAAGIDTFRASGRPDGLGAPRMVRTGAVPTRTLNIADSYGHDAYGHRLIYAVTENYAVEGEQMTGDNGAIYIYDHEDPAIRNSSTSTPGNVEQVVYSMGWDTNGAYSIDGVQIQACDPNKASGENCDFDGSAGGDAEFKNTINKSTNHANNNANLFVHSFSYEPNRHIITCEEKSPEDMPRHTAFIVDTSGSMETDGSKPKTCGANDPPDCDPGTVQCPADMPGCRRIDVAHWAMRRVMPASMYSQSQNKEPGKTDMTGFVSTAPGQIKHEMDDNNFFLDPSDIDPNDPETLGFFSPESLDGDHDNDGIKNAEDIDEYIGSLMGGFEDKLEQMCPSGKTPLGLHIKETAQRLRAQMRTDIVNGGNPIRFSKITIISDGLSNVGTDPLDIANEIAAMRNETPPIDIRVDIVDVVGNPGLQQVSQITGGKYYRSDNPDELLKALNASAGVCATHAPVVPPDQENCGGNQGWWDNN